MRAAEDPEFTQNMFQAQAELREARERELIEQVRLQDLATHLDIQRARLREQLASPMLLRSYHREERPVHFNPAYHVEEPPEIREALDARAAHEMEIRRAYSGSETSNLSGGSHNRHREGWGMQDLRESLGRFRRRDRVDMYMREMPDLYDEPFAVQAPGCTSAAEEALLREGYGDWRWRSYFLDPNTHESMQSGHVADNFGRRSTVDATALTRRLAHLGTVESRDEEWYEEYGHSNW
jgi:hypothetical protein